MDFLKPPTDSLYKFLFVGGLVLIGGAIIFHGRSRDAAAEAMAAYNKAHFEAARTYFLVFADRVPVDKMKQTIIDASELTPINLQTFDANGASNEMLKEYAEREAQLVQRSVRYPPAVVRKKTLSPENIEAAAKVHGFDDPSEFKKFLENLPDAEVTSASTESLVQINDALKSLSSAQAATLNMRTAIVAHQNNMLGIVALFFVGTCFTCAGAIGWYFLSQRYQDQILKREAEQIGHLGGKGSRRSPARPEHRRA